ncbi:MULTISPECIES: hypothetical protein [Achromobacter]|uniref:hypothetical protein n=1 Tax=Achromobacter TaxID=222 RepID=UPI0012E0E80F|nr:MULTISPECIES: hypothetical protein [Achromobacter]
MINAITRDIRLSVFLLDAHRIRHIRAQGPNIAWNEEPDPRSHETVQRILYQEALRWRTEVQSELDDSSTLLQTVDPVLRAHLNQLEFLPHQGLYFPDWAKYASKLLTHLADELDKIVQGALSRIEYEELRHNEKIERRRAQLIRIYCYMAFALCAIAIIVIMGRLHILQLSSATQDIRPCAAQCVVVVSPPAPQTARDLEAPPQHHPALLSWLRGALFAIGVSLFLAGIMLLIRTKQHLLGATLATLGVVTGSIGLSIGNIDAALFRLDRLVDSLKIEISLIKQSRSVEPSPPARPFHTMLHRVASIGPFPDGDHVGDADSALRCMTTALKAYGPGGVIGGWQIVGRVDKRDLKPEPRRMYGSNQALAMARAEWVVTHVMNEIVQLRGVEGVVSIGGARSIGTEVTVDKLEADRYVDVFVLLNAQDPSPPIASLDCRVQVTRPESGR